MPTNDFLPVATAGGANVLSQAAYAASPYLSPGQQSGIAQSAFNNKALRQATYMVSCLAQFLANTTGNDVLDDTVSAEILATMALAWPSGTPPTVTSLTATGTVAGYLFTCSSANATVGATYTNNGHTFTVLATLVAGTQLFCSGALAPLTSGTLTKGSGTGDATITFSAEQALATYTTPANVKYLKITMVGGGGGGAGGGSSSGGEGAGTSGSASTFGSALLIANGGTGGAIGGSYLPIAGGAAIVNSPAVSMLAITGGVGGVGSGFSGGAGITNFTGGNGGNNPLAGGGGGSASSVTASAGAANTGSGGGAGGTTATANAIPGCGGGAGAYILAQITGPSGTYYYSIGAGGAAGAAGSNGGGGAAGAAGQILVEEHYAG